MRLGERHYSEEELLMHFLGEETPEMGSAVASHLVSCGRCTAVFQEYRELQERILRWQSPELPEETWETRKLQLLDSLREETRRTRRAGILSPLMRLIQGAWSYALENPLPTLGYVIIAVAFASERTITTFRLDRILPGTNEVLAILRQVF